MRFLKEVLICSTIVLFSIASAMGQTSDTTFYNGITHQKPKFFFAFDNSRTFLRGQNTRVQGFKLGAEMDDRFRLGVGFYSLNADIVDEVTVSRDGLPDTNRLAQLKMGWATISYDHIFFSKGKWQFSVPVNLGLGNSYYEYFDEGQSLRTQEGPILLLWAGVNGQYKVIRFAGLGFGAGYGGFLVSNENIEEKLNSPYYVLKVQVYLGEIARALFGKKED